MSVIPRMRPTVRRRVGNVSMYVLAAIIVIILVFTVDWATVGKQFADPDVIAKLWPGIVTIGLVNTLYYTFASFILGTILGTALALMKMGGGPFGWFAIGFIELFRGIPALLTIFATVFMVPMAFGFNIPGGASVSGIIALTIVTGAYTAEIIRAGIQAVPVGQREAARSLGMTGMQTMFWVVLPQGFRIVIPPMTNELVMLLKDSSLLFIAGMAITEREMTTMARDAVSSNMSSTPFIVAAVFYLVITLPLTYLAGRLERVHATQQSGLAGARRADHANHLALRDRQVNAAQHVVLAEILVQPLDLDGRDARVKRRIEFAHFLRSSHFSSRPARYVRGNVIAK